MSNDEIIEMARQAGFFINDELTITSPFIEDICISPMLKEFAKLVADKARQELREEVIYTWVPPSFVDFAIKTEREACAKVCSRLADEALVVGDEDAVMCFEEAENTIRARGEA